MTEFDERFSLSQQIEEIKREIAMRGRVYPGLVARGKMRKGEAEFHMSRMQAVLTTLQRIAGASDD